MRANRRIRSLKEEVVDSCVPVALSVGHDYDKLKRIGHLVRVSAWVSVGDDCDKLKHIGHFVVASPQA